MVSTAVGLTLAVTPSFAAKQTPATHPSLNTVHQAGLKGWKSNQSHGVVLPKGSTLALTWSTSAVSGSGFLADPTSFVNFKCKLAAKCNVITESVAQVLSGPGSGTFDNLAICPVMNGIFTNGSCFYSGNSSFSDQYHTITNDTNAAGVSGANTGYVLLYSPWTATWAHRQNQWHL